MSWKPSLEKWNIKNDELTTQHEKWTVSVVIFVYTVLKRKPCTETWDWKLAGVSEK